MIFIGPSDLAGFSGTKMGDARFEGMIKRIHDVTLKAGLKPGTITGMGNRPDFTFLVGESEASLIKAGVKAMFRPK